MFPATAQSLEFESDRLNINDRTGEVVLTGNVRAWNDTVTITSRRLIIRYEAQGDTVKSYEAFGDVRIDHDTMHARAQYAFRDNRADTLFLQENAYVSRNGNEFWAERMTVDLRTSQVDMSGSVRGNVRSRRKSTKPTDKLRGRGRD